MNDKQIAKLIRKNAEKAGQPSKLRPAQAYDPTLQNREEDPSSNERLQFFKEMKRREF